MRLKEIAHGDRWTGLNEPMAPPLSSPEQLRNDVSTGTNVIQALTKDSGCQSCTEAIF